MMSSMIWIWLALWDVDGDVGYEFGEGDVVHVFSSLEETLDMEAPQFITSAIRHGFMERRKSNKINDVGPIILSQNGW